MATGEILASGSENNGGGGGAAKIVGSSNREIISINNVNVSSVMSIIEEISMWRAMSNIQCGVMAVNVSKILSLISGNGQYLTWQAGRLANVPGQPALSQLAGWRGGSVAACQLWLWHGSYWQLCYQPHNGWRQWQKPKWLGNGVISMKA